MERESLSIIYNPFNVTHLQDACVRVCVCVCVCVCVHPIGSVSGEP